MMKAQSKINRVRGFALFFISIFLFVIYSYFLLATQWGLVILQITVLAAVGAMVAVLAWIGFTMATASRP
jgi:hypothetical protein